MSVDLKKIKVGDKIRLRNGEVQIVSECRWHQAHKTKYPVVVNGDTYTTEGLYNRLSRSAFDIVEIIPAETLIDASKIKVGDKIRLRNGEIHTVTDFTTQACSIYPLLIDFPGRSEGYTLNGLLWLNERHDGDIVEIIPAETSEEEPTQDEMTMRDQFAMAAMSGILTKDKKYPLYKDLARWSYEIADEMMKARKGIDE